MDELYPSIGRDGALYTGSNRDGGEGGFDIWRAMPRGDGTFGPAVNLGTPVNTSGWEFNPAFSPLTGHLVFVRIAVFDRPSGEIMASRPTWSGEWRKPVALTGVNTSEDEYHPSFSPNGLRMYFVRNTVTPGSNGDFYSVPIWHLGLR